MTCASLRAPARAESEGDERCESVLSGPGFDTLLLCVDNTPDEIHRDEDRDDWSWSTANC